MGGGNGIVGRARGSTPICMYPGLLHSDQLVPRGPTADSHRSQSLRAGGQPEQGPRAAVARGHLGPLVTQTGDAHTTGLISEGTTPAVPTDPCLDIAGSSPQPMAFPPGGHRGIQWTFADISLRPRCSIWQSRKMLLSAQRGLRVLGPPGCGGVALSRLP